MELTNSTLEYQRSTKSKTSICLLLSKFLVTVETTRRDKLGHAKCAYLNAFILEEAEENNATTTTTMTHGKMALCSLLTSLIFA